MWGAGTFPWINLIFTAKKCSFSPPLYISTFPFYVKLVKHSASLNLRAPFLIVDYTEEISGRVRVQALPWTQQAIKVLCKDGVTHILLYSSAEHACNLLLV